jgi:hypothetical protein
MALQQTTEHKMVLCQMQEAQGQWPAMQAVFMMHTLAHSHRRELTGRPGTQARLPRRSRGEVRRRRGASSKGEAGA